METDPFENIDKGFSGIYAEYEQLSRENAIDIARREIIRNHVESYLKPQHKILEINAGSGIDAVYFAQKGNSVLATDIAEESEKYIEKKITALALHNLKFCKCSFTELQKIDGKFDHIFSNFGGLNCIADLSPVFKSFEKLLNPGGYVTLVIMPPFYPWEMATFLKGNKDAFRRFRKNGARANVSGQSVTAFYHSPKDVKIAMGRKFRHVKTRNLGTFYPSFHFESLQKNSALVSKLLNFDRWANNLPFMVRGMGDYFIITFQKPL